jgi:hypothetical protein
MANAPSYCADLRPDFKCFVQGWPQCCVTDGRTCPPSFVPACDIRSNNPPTKNPTKTKKPTSNPTLLPTLPYSHSGSCTIKPPYDAHRDSDPFCGSASYCSIPVGVCKNEAVIVGTCEEMPHKICSDYEPICGCDGRTYDSLCHANVAGVNIRKNGHCY